MRSLPNAPRQGAAGGEWHALFKGRNAGLAHLGGSMGRVGKRLDKALRLVVSMVLGSAGTAVSGDRFTARRIRDYHIERVLARGVSSLRRAVPLA